VQVRLEAGKPNNEATLPYPVQQKVGPDDQTTTQTCTVTRMEQDVDLFPLHQWCKKLTQVTKRVENETVLEKAWKLVGNQHC
jgi:hypothetical protein